MLTSFCKNCWLIIITWQQRNKKATWVGGQRIKIVKAYRRNAALPIPTIKAKTKKLR